MSYILDALRRADAERERGAVPGLHTRTPEAATPAAPARTRRGPWLAAGAAGGVAVAALAVWLLGGTRPPAGAAAPTAVAPRGDGEQAVAGRAPAAPRLAAPLAQAPIAAVTPPAAKAPPARPAAESSAAPTVRTATTPAPASPGSAGAAAAGDAPRAADGGRADGAVERPQHPPAPGVDSRSGAAAAAPERPLPLERLPADVRRTLPTLAIGGAVWSEHAPSRMLLVGGQLLHEGETAAPGIVLERIGPRSAVLRRGTLRWEVAY